MAVSPLPRFENQDIKGTQFLREEDRPDLYQKTTGIIQSQLIFFYIFSWYHFFLIFVEGYKK